MGKVVGSFKLTQHPAQCINKYLLVEKTHQHNNYRLTVSETIFLCVAMCSQYQIVKVLL